MNPLEVWANHPNKGDGARHAARLMWMRRMCLPSPPYTILDLGCGEGAGSLNWCAGDVDDENLNIGSSHFQHHAGVDVNKDFINYSRTRHPGCRFEVFDLMETKKGARIPFPENSFDTILVTEVIEHLPKDCWAPFIKDVRRICRKQVLLTVPDSGQPNRVVDLYPKHPANQLHIGHQFEPCYTTWNNFLRDNFPGEQVHTVKIMGFFTACCWVNYV